MATHFGEPDFEGRINDKLPLLVDENTSTSRAHVVNIVPTTSFSVEFQGFSSTSRDPSSSNLSQERRVLPTPSIGSSRGSSLPPVVRSLALLGRESDGARQGVSYFSLGVWISVELITSIAQIIAAIVVLALSSDETPQAPLLFAWVVVYALGCLAILPLLYWRYTRRYVLQQPEQELVTPSAISPSSPPTSPHVFYTTPISTLSLDEEADASLSSLRANWISRCCNLRLGIFMERYKVALDCFFALWFVAGNVWIFGGHSSFSDAPNLYRLCIVFLALSCISYATPFILCSAICCCLPCIITFLGFREDRPQAKGAALDVIQALPTFKFKAARHSIQPKSAQDGNDSDSNNGMDRETSISTDDAVCCICLGNYKDGVKLRELPCSHSFHVQCIDEWLKINASCPLCKHEIDSCDRTDL